ncbi:MAG: DNA recombination protein RmuC [bacterium]
MDTTIGALLFAVGLAGGVVLGLVLARLLKSREQAQLREAFQALSAGALERNNEQFLQLAKTSFETLQAQAKGDLELRNKAVEGLVTPLKESLDKLQQHNQALERARHEAYGGLNQQVKNLMTAQEKLNTETGKLVTALRAPQGRGRWGEMQLRRVVEMAGMLDHVDFMEQQSVSTEEGRLQPDLIVNLPGGKQVVVDAKTPLLAYLEAVEAEDEELRTAKLREHAAQVKTHVKKLSAKAYWEQFPSAPEFVVMFLPGESFFSAALEQDPELIELGAQQRVILATPTTLIALLRAVAYGWRQERITENAERISELGRSLYERLAIMTEHFQKVGGSLQRATKAYNDTIGTLERNVLSAGRRFTELGVASKRELEVLEPVEGSVREIQAKELLAESGSPESEAG